MRLCVAFLPLVLYNADAPQLIYLRGVVSACGVRRSKVKVKVTESRS